MNGSGKISVIIPIYNAQQTLPRCLESLRQQTYPHWEALLVDDGSCDASIRLCEGQAGADKRFTLLRQEHQGVSAARNAGIQNASGEFIAFLDADDYAEPQMLETLYGWIEGSRADIAACGYYMENAQSRFVASRPAGHALLEGEEAILLAMQRGFYQGFLWNKLFRSAVFPKQDAPWFSGKLQVCEDLLFLVGCLSRGMRLYYRSEPLYHYGMYDSSLTRNRELSRLSELEARAEILSRIPAQYPRALRMARCKYSETAASLQHIAMAQGAKGDALYYRQEARRYAKVYYGNPDIRLREKLRFFLKCRAPRAAEKAGAAYRQCRSIVTRKGRGAG